VQLTEGAAVLTIPEASKTSALPDGRLFSVPNTGEIRSYGDGSSKSIVKLYLSKQEDAVSDQVVLRWGNASDATDGFDYAYDAYDMGRKSGPDLSVLDTKGTVYSIFHGTRLKHTSDEHRVITLNTANLTESVHYELKTELISPLEGNNQAWIYDRYTDEYIAIEAAVKSYSFKVNADTLSKSAQRFTLVFNKASALAGELSSGSNAGMQVMGNPMKGNVVQLMSKGNYQNVSWQLLSNNGTVLGTGTLTDVRKGMQFSLKSTKEMPSGMYLIRLNGDSQALPSLKVIK